MQRYKKLYSMPLVTFCLTVFATRTHAGGDVSISGIDRIIATSSTPADPGVMIVVGVGLVAIRVLIARRFRRHEKNRSIPHAMGNEAPEFALSDPRTSSGTH